MNFNESLIAYLLDEAIDPKFQPETPYPPGFLQRKPLNAAVLIPLLRQDQEWHLLFIRRTYHEHDPHKGQVAFPGGRCNSTDKNFEDAALRESFEETGIHPEDVEILGRLRDMLTITGYLVRPIVGIIPWPYPVKPQPSEVSRIFTIPLQWLADSNNRQIQTRKFQIRGETIPVIYFKPYDGEVLWGASARIVVLLLEALGLSNSEDRYRDELNPE